LTNQTLRGDIDHFVLAAPDLARACAEFERATGVTPIAGGAHPGRGTHNALVAFDDSAYLEIIAPDPAQTPTGMSAPMAKLPAPTLMHWAIRSSGLESLAARLREIGWTPTPVNRMSRTPPGGARLEWELFGVHRHRFGGLAPFFIDWLNSPRPPSSSPRVGALRSVRLATEDPLALRNLVALLGVDVEVVAGPPSLAIAFASPRGEIRYEGTDPRGFTLGD
jgi:Glyoxalase-like domain